MQLPEAVFKEKHGVMGPYAGVDYNSPYQIVNSAVSYPPPLYKDKGWNGEISPIGWAQLYLSAYLQTGFFMKTHTQVQKSGWEGRQPHAWADFNPTP